MWRNSDVSWVLVGGGAVMLWLGAGEWRNSDVSCVLVGGGTVVLAGCW